VTITVVPPPIPWVSATTQSNRIVQLIWPVVPNATAYRIERTTSVGGAAQWSLDVPGNTAAYEDTVPLSANPVTYIYYVRVKEDQYGEWSERGGYDYATAATTLWSQSSVVPGTMARGADVQELRKAIDAFRVAFGKPATFSSSTTPTGVITAANLTALVSALNGGRSGTYLDFAYVGVPAPAPGGMVLAAHIQQLRDALH
jgi:hypothetical protein